MLECAFKLKDVVELYQHHFKADELERVNVVNGEVEQTVKRNTPTR